MVDPRNVDSRADFFINEAKRRQATRPRVVDQQDNYYKAKQLERGRRMEVSEQLYAAGYLNLRCIISYTKITEDYATRIWLVEPYSYRYRWLTSGGRWQPPILKKVFFGYDVEDDTIKMFMYGNIHDVTITNETFSPRWEVEISRPGAGIFAGPWSPFSGTDAPEF